MKRKHLTQLTKVLWIVSALFAFTLVSCEDETEAYSSSESNSTSSYTSNITLDIFYTYIDVANADTTLYSNVEIEQTVRKTYSYESSDGTSYQTSDTTSFESAQATFYFDGEEVAQLTSSPYSFEYDLTGFSSGEHAVYVDVITYQEDGETQSGSANYDTSFLVLEPGAIDFDLIESKGYTEDGSYLYAYLSLNSSDGLDKIYSVAYYWDGELLAETDSCSEVVTLPTTSTSGHTLEAIVLLEATASDTTLFYFTITSTF